MPACSKHNRVTLARSLFTPRSTFRINPFGLDNSGARDPDQLARSLGAEWSGSC